MFHQLALSPRQVCSLGFRTGHFFALMSLVIMLANGLMWFENLQPKHTSDALIFVDASKHQAYHIKQHVAGIYENRLQQPQYTFDGHCSVSNIDEQPHQVKTPSDATATNAMQTLQQTITGLEEHARYVDTQYAKKYIQSVQSTIENQQAKQNLQHYRLHTSTAVIERIRYICRTQSDQAYATQQLKNDLDSDVQYVNLHPEWKRIVLSWLENMNKPGFSTTQKSKDMLQTIVEFDQTHPHPTQLPQTSAHANLQKLENWQKRTTHSSFDPIFILP